jgi:hypothetical protein
MYIKRESTSPAPWVRLVTLDNTWTLTIECAREHIAAVLLDLERKAVNVIIRISHEHNISSSFLGALDYH